MIISREEYVAEIEAENAELRAEIDRLRVGFTRYLQSDNDCPITGIFCRTGCGCDLEMQYWVRWALGTDVHSQDDK